MAITTETRGAVRIATLNRPEVANALDGATLAELVDCFDDADADDGTRVVVLTGAGDRAFCAGEDLKALAAGEEMDRTVTTRFVELLRDGISTPVIAAVNGAAVAGGFELVLACDLVVAAEHARFGLPEVERGLLAAGGGTLLPTRIPLAIALELGLTGDPIDAHRAYELGLVNRVVPAAALMDTALALAESITANGPLSVTVTKRLMREANAVPARQAWASLEASTPVVFGSDDAREGALAFAEKRAPRWTGR